MLRFVDFAKVFNSIKHKDLLKILRKTDTDVKDIFTVSNRLKKEWQQIHRKY